MRRTLCLPLVLVWLGVACAPSAPNSSASQVQPAAPARTLVAVVQSEPKTLAARIIGQSAVSLNLVRRLFNADLALLDDQAVPHPYLADALPQLDTDSWQVFPDGTMRTTYHLKPNLVWQDGSPLTADDFVFSWHVYTMPDLGQATSLPFKLIDDVQAPDSQTIMIHWTQPYAAAGALQSLGSSALVGLPPLPRAILGPTFESGSALDLMNNAFWTTGYVGLGPYRLDRWEPGSFIEASAFDQHVLGPAKILHIKLMFVPDPNAALASILAGDAQLASDQALGLAQAISLKQQWQAGGGSIVPYFNQWLAAHFQNRPDYVSPAALQDVRVRQALASAVDREDIDQSLYDGQLPIADSIFPPTSDLGKAVDAAITKYPFDPAHSAQLMADAGFTKGADGLYIGPGGVAFSPQLRVASGADAQTQMDALASGWRQVGFDFQEFTVPTAQDQDLQVKSTYPGLLISAMSGGEGGISNVGTANIPGPANQWHGNAWDGYSNPEMDRLVTVFSAALAPQDRTQAAVDVAKLYNTDLPAISLFFPITPWVFSSDISGVEQRPAVSNVAWNIYDWELR